MGKSLRSVTLINKTKDGIAYRINVWGPRDAFGPTDYPVEIQVYNPDCQWVRTVISDREIEKRLDDLFDEAFREKTGDSPGLMPPSPTLNGSQQTGRPEK